MPRDPRTWVPRWWRGEGGRWGAVLDLALWPAERLYRAVVRARSHAYDRGWARTARAPIPVVSVGNIAVGGAGKTPVSAFLARRFAELGWRPAMVLRGYGADEILVHREINPDVPVFAHRRRIEAVRAAEREGCTLAVVDDGFQHRALEREADVVLVAAETWNPAPRLLPRGPWREPPRSLRRAGLVVVTRKSASAERAAEVARGLARDLSPEIVFMCDIAPVHLTPLGSAARPVPLSALAGRPVVAVASLADPRPFAEHLELAGAGVELLAFPDHHEFSPGDVAAITRTLGTRPVVMTHKEAVKLRDLLAPDTEAYVLEQEVAFPDEERFMERLLDLVGRGRA